MLCFIQGIKASVPVVVRYDKWAYDVDKRCFCKTKLTRLCVAGGGGANVCVAVYHDRRAQSALFSRYERSKFAIQRIDFWVPSKIARNDREMTPHVAGCCRAVVASVLVIVC